SWRPNASRRGPKAPGSRPESAQPRRQVKETGDETQAPRSRGRGAARAGVVSELGRFRAPAMIRWPGQVPVGKVENGIISGIDWFPTLVAAAGNSSITEELKKGKQLGGTPTGCIWTATTRRT